MISDFHSGLTFWWRGWGHIRHRQLLAVALIPVLISSVTFVGFVWLIWGHLGLWVAQLIAAVGVGIGGFWYDLAYYPLMVGGGLIVFLAALYIVFIAHAFVAVPFYSLLAERALAQQGKKPVGLSFVMTLRLFRASAVKSLLLLLVGVILFVFSFVPVLNVFAIAGAMLIFAFDCMDYAFDGMGFGFRQRVGYLFRERMQWLGMAAGLALTLLIPGLTLLVTPGAVVGSALILKDRK